jgi:cytochrome P450
MRGRLAKEVVAGRFTPDAEDKHDMLVCSPLSRPQKKALEHMLANTRCAQGSFIRHGVTQAQCETEVPFQILAGSDTTATAIRGTMLHLMATPLAYQKLQVEIDAAIAQGRISSPAKADEGRELEYLQVYTACTTHCYEITTSNQEEQAVIYEGLRINIPFSGMMSK